MQASDGTSTGGPSSDGRALYVHCRDMASLDTLWIVVLYLKPIFDPQMSRKTTGFVEPEVFARRAHLDGEMEETASHHV